MRFYRVETPDGLGPWHANHRFYVYELCQRVGLDPEMHNELPTPYQEGLPVTWGNYMSGVVRPEDLDVWFPPPLRAALAREGFMLTECEAEQVHVGVFQVAAVGPIVRVTTRPL